MVLDVRSLVKRYGAQQVVNNVSFQAGKAEIIGFLGPNGAGKSTTMKIITGCIQSDQGYVYIDGFDIVKDDLKAKKQIGYLPENNPLYDDMYIAEYLEYVSGLYDRNHKETVQTVIAKTGLKPEAHKLISQLSKGYKQRVGLAQAIIHDPALLILDEPMSGLDPNQMDEIKALLRQLSPGKTILFSSHTLAEVASICTRIIIIHQGNIVADKLIDEIPDLEYLFKTLTKE